MDIDAEWDEEEGELTISGAESLAGAIWTAHEMLPHKKRVHLLIDELEAYNGMVQEKEAIGRLRSGSVYGIERSTRELIDEIGRYEYGDD